MLNILYPFATELGGGEMRTLQLRRDYERLMSAPARIWATSWRSRRAFRQQEKIALLAPWNLPMNEPVIMVGYRSTPKRWMLRMRPSKLTIIVNSMTVTELVRHLPLYRQMHPQPQTVFGNRLQQQVFGIEGPVHLSSMDIQKFRPAERAENSGRFRLGRHSRDHLDKHQLLDDPALYRELLADGCEVDLLGAACVQPLLSDSTGIVLRKAGSVDAAEYLRSLDCFFYRTGAHYETAGRSVFEAMATGLPVVVYRYGGYIEFIVDGESGFVFESQQQAAEIIRHLRAHPEECRRVGANARKTMEQLFGDENMRRQLAYYV